MAAKVTFNVANDAKLWRYFSLPKLLHFLQTKRCIFQEWICSVTLSKAIQYSEIIRRADLLEKHEHSVAFRTTANENVG